MIFISRILILVIVFIGVAAHNEICEVLRPDNRSEVGALNYLPGRRLNIFPNISTPRASNLTSVSFYAAKPGHVYISFWSERNSSTFELLQKVSLAASNAPGVNIINFEEQIWLEEGSILGIHYGKNASAGVIHYEASTIDGRTPDVPLLNFYNKDVKDDGWEIGYTVDMGEIRAFLRNVAIHLNLCNHCMGNTFGQECTPCNSNCVHGHCNTSTGHCLQGCNEGYSDPTCSTFNQHSIASENTSSGYSKVDVILAACIPSILLLIISITFTIVFVELCKKVKILSKETGINVLNARNPIAASGDSQADGSVATGYESLRFPAHRPNPGN